MELLKFAVIWFSLTIMPGPDIIFVTTESIKNGARNGIKIAMGLATGMAFHSLVVLTGFGLIIAKFPTVTEVVKYIGASYLVYIGVRTFISAFKNSGENLAAKILSSEEICPENGEAKIIEEGSDDKNFGDERKKLDYNPYVRGIIMNVTNPKLLIFFLSFLPQILDLENITLLDSFLVFLILVGIALSTFVIMAIFSSKISAYFKRDGGLDVNMRKFLAFFEMAIYLTIAGGVLFSN